MPKTRWSYCSFGPRSPNRAFEYEYEGETATSIFGDVSLGNSMWPAAGRILRAFVGSPAPPPPLVEYCWINGCASSSGESKVPPFDV